MNRKKFVVILVLAVVVAVTALWGYKMFCSAAVEERVTVVLRDDESYDQMLAKVKSSVAYPMALSVCAKCINLDKSLKSGKYTFTKGMTVFQVVRILKFGTNNRVLLVINNARTPEALASKIAMQIDADSTAIVAALRNESIIKEMGFDSAEAMFSIFVPNTYEVYSDITPESLVRRLKRESDAFWANEDRQAKLKDLDMTAFEVMTLASIVHEETNATDEMARIAGVYINRLNRGMRLQADPTLKYAVGDPTIRRVLDKHKRVDSPYNTYMYVGLPPTPIAMPDMSAIEAVLNYEEHDYLYFCARAEMDGRHNFAKTLGEHNKNAAEYHRALDELRIK